MPVKTVDNSKKVFAALREAQKETLESVGKQWVQLVQDELPAGETRNSIRFHLEGNTRLVIEFGGQMQYFEYGTGVRGKETAPEGPASGLPYNVPRGSRDDQGKWQDDPRRRQKHTVTVGYKNFRRSDGSVGSVAIKKEVRTTSGRRPGKKALKITMPDGRIIFRHRIENHQGMPAKRIIARTRAKIVDELWSTIAKKTYTMVAKRRGIAVARLRQS